MKYKKYYIKKVKKKVISPEEVYRNRRKIVLPSDKDPEYTYGIPTRYIHFSL